MTLFIDSVCLFTSCFTVAFNFNIFTNSLSFFSHHNVIFRGFLYKKIHKQKRHSLHKKCLYLLFSLFNLAAENADQKNWKYRHFLHSDCV